VLVGTGPLGCELGDTSVRGLVVARFGAR
jgi:hypothetical protein